MLQKTFSVLLPLGISLVNADLSGTVGPTSSFVHKADVMLCDVTDYGASSSADFGPAFTSAWDACAEAGGGLVYIPPGEYPISTGVNVKDADDMAVQWDGTVYRDGDVSGDYFFSFTNLVNFELFSGNSKGALQGYGYEYLKDGNYGTRLLLFHNINNASIHGLTLVDSPAYYVVIKTCTSLEAYNMLIRGVSTIGETDAFDVSGSNIWVHDVEITNGDECVTVKSPSSNFRIGSIFCNLSGGTAIGSLGSDTMVQNITYQNLYMNGADACFIKTNGGNGTVSSISWDTVYVNGSAYPLAIDEAWGDAGTGIGVQISDLSFKDWYGYNSDNSRPTIRLECDPDVPCYDIILDGVHLWTSDGDSVEWSCQNAYGSGACLKSGSTSLSTYTTSSIVSTVSSWSLPGTMAGEFTSELSPTASFTIPPLATSFFPGQTPTSTLLSYSGPATYGAVQG
ncbi:RGase C [Penicillium longicatenatum]|uniref:RGase C n=1 Tax=Penicillium longicatenatum TaxID=1561947 RepID=UPI002548A144|nr:RGase C [Penicillium longicatenatum]KAJ5658402.1 RGase C [Penicillium longicatenatum]